MCGARNLCSDAAAIGPAAPTSGWKVGQINSEERLQNVVIPGQAGNQEWKVLKVIDARVL
jgi:hypothetical protein